LTSITEFDIGTECHYSQQGMTLSGWVFVTGASSGLGEATALEFARGGARVIAGFRRLTDGDALKKKAPGIVCVQIDLADPASILRAGGEVDRISGPEGLSALVNAAGYAIYGPIEHTAGEDVQRLFQVLTFGPAQLTNALRPSLARRLTASGPRAKIFNVISWSWMDAAPFVGYYAAAKSALLRLTEAQMYELDRFGIDATAIVPGLMRTSFLARAGTQVSDALARLSPEGLRDYGEPLRKLAEMSKGAPKNPLAVTPEKVARRIVSLARRNRLGPQYNIGIDTAIVAAMKPLLPFCFIRRIKVAMFGLDELPAVVAADFHLPRNEIVQKVNHHAR